MTGRVALVSGGNRGIGLATARALADAGDRVVIAARKAGDFGGGLHSVRCDVDDNDSVTEAFTQVERDLGRVEVLVANAGIVRDGLLMSQSDEDFRAVLETNLLGAVRLVRRALRGMLRGHGRIVLVSSVSALTGSRGQTGYAAAKAGLIGLARSLALETKARDITVNVVAPGWIDTDMTADLPEPVRKKGELEVPLGRFGRPEEVAAAIRFLTSREAGYITGAVLPVDGGLGMGL
ncbi:3-oxoacyl-ACP reductase FabG [Crossiella sp. CA-258035]|uniref:3-oxoacyl-ACP reductase FabG n=1 Tax=Crossiella sp. CA-258035 TaxID=2981138 RepID=UPI0024BCF9BE|nr:3-oxoacyl-ACP reductase FabG [Crossiella sp. CA-258035]WHT17569.1 3-oxoacyl-ACP reductase FabG [Crossiella sp. CA-258035]